MSEEKLLKSTYLLEKTLKTIGYHCHTRWCKFKELRHRCKRCLLYEEIAHFLDVPIPSDRTFHVDLYDYYSQTKKDMESVGIVMFDYDELKTAELEAFLKQLNKPLDKLTIPGYRNKVQKFIYYIDQKGE